MFRWSSRKGSNYYMLIIETDNPDAQKVLEPICKLLIDMNALSRKKLEEMEK